MTCINGLPPYNPQRPMVDQLMEQIQHLELQIEEIKKERDRHFQENVEGVSKRHELLRLNEELTKKGEALCGQAGWALVVLNRLLSLRYKQIAVDGDHPEFCDCDWCKAWGDVREVTGRSEKRVASGQKNCHCCVDCEAINIEHLCRCHA